MDYGERPEADTNEHPLDGLPLAGVFAVYAACTIYQPAKLRCITLDLRP